jgi:outer membrane lipoprotein carrier protein
MMKSTTAKLVFYSFVLIGILVLAPMGDTQDLCAATETVNLSVDQILDRVEKRYTNSKFSADFIQKSTIKAMDITDVETGKVFFKYPGMMRWEYNKPYRKIYISDGEKLWRYIPDDNQVTIAKAPAFFRSGKGASFFYDIQLIRQKFDISLEQVEQGENDMFYYLKLTPKEKTPDISEIRLMVSKQTFNVLQVMTLNFYGDETRIDLINYIFNVNIEDSLFSFKIPEGADVLQWDE